MVRESRHSMLVQWAKVALPLLALVLLSTLFLFSGKVDPTTASIYAKVDVDALVAEPRLTTPEYSGMTEEGAALTVRATTATPDPNGNGASASDVIAKLEGADGAVTDLTAAAGVLDPQAGQISLSEGVAVQTSSGYRMATEAVDMATDRGILNAPGAVRGEGPFGTLEAGSMQMGRSDPSSPYDLHFKGGVKLIYQPEK
ncbi:lipopolysaccharide export system protein LptC [Rhodobacter aestuarii]|uniref:Lipopolysaccharide export system protein LptC n=1 Tax=Rhodobacter aestuarii TaxID=453582 RepID=A0A1N7QEU6_9RHOB|nr:MULTISPECIES: hypothetical protein [Rhodobacter]PTV93524.1 lipopolysaccharide export system protein LptC [Rhodobacter aestuarii]SIT21289.1 lipopolysaccharide export system protein LptC [Rhodobacter aestuarii]SOC08406.1 lipopolysaccharide export system protein LptC [Rhodobacter sp. JA431]